MNNQQRLLNLLEQNIEEIQNQPDRIKEQYLSMMVMLTKCFKQDAEAGCILMFKPDKEEFAICVANLNQADAFEVVNLVYDKMLKDIMQEAPPKEMFN